MVERFMWWLGYVPEQRLHGAYEMISAWKELCGKYGGQLTRLRQYAHVRKIEATIEKGTARKK